MKIPLLSVAPWCALAGLLILPGAAFADSADDDVLLAQRIEAHIDFLADDLLRGRQPGTPGFDIAAAYVASQYRQMGLQPAGNEGSYLQQVPLRRAWQEPGSAQMAIEVEGRRETLEFVSQFYIAPGLTHEVSAVDAQAGFVG
jgi:hypothetical protein